MSVRVVPVPCLRDNFAYLVVEGDVAAVVDPGEAAPVLAAAEALGVRVSEVWCTHHHADHVGGVGELLAALGPLEVVASAYDVARGRAPHATRALSDGDTLAFGRARFGAWEVPGHTLGALAFVGEGVAFTGDTLFGAGCGRVFEGTMPMMAGQFLLLMVFLDKTWFSPVGDLLDKRDGELRSKLSVVKDNGGAVKSLQDEADEVLASARKAAQAQVAEAKATVSASAASELAAAKAKVDAELGRALASLEAEKDAALKGLDAQVSKLSGDILGRVLPEGVRL